MQQAQNFELFKKKVFCYMATSGVKTFVVQKLMCSFGLISCVVGPKHVEPLGDVLSVLSRGKIKKTYILESNPHLVFATFLNKKKLVRASNPHLSFNRPLPTGRLFE
jgi:hypothetical protein